jgi:hypothetical protein
MLNNQRFFHKLYPEFESLRRDDSDFREQFKDTDSDFFEWAISYEIDSDWGINHG